MKMNIFKKLKFAILILILFILIIQTFFVNIIWKDEPLDIWTQSHENLTYLLEPTYFNCSDSFKLLILVKSAIHEFAERQSVRNTWGLETLNLGMFYFFAIGDSENETIREMVNSESDLFGDILQINLVESYHRLTLKTYSNLRWITEFCSNDKLIFFTDCDMILSPERLLNFSNYYENQNAIIGNCWSVDSSVERNRRNDKFVPRSVWNRRTFPPFCSGAAHFMTVEIARKLLKAIPNGANNVRWAYEKDYLDDVMFTGVLRVWAKVRIQHLSSDFVWLSGFDPNKFCNDENELYKYICESKLISVINSIRPPAMFYHCWTKYLATLKNCTQNL